MFWKGSFGRRATRFFWIGMTTKGSSNGQSCVHGVGSSRKSCKLRQRIEMEANYRLAPKLRLAPRLERQAANQPRKAGRAVLLR